MKALVNTVPGRLEWLDWLMPEPKAGQVRIRTVACGICATDLEMIHGWQRTPCPSVPGHEWSGVVDAVGEGVDASVVGKPCVAENVLSDGGEVGFEHAGGYGQYLITDARNVHTLPEDFPLESAALIEPLAVCVRGMYRMRLEPRQPVLVFGDGPIGLLLLALLRTESVETVALIGGREPRLALAKEFGATAVFNYHDVDDLAEAIKKLPGSPFPNIIEATGSASALKMSMDVAATGGKILLLGDYAESRADFPWNQVLHRELELIGSNASAGAWSRAVYLAVSGRIPLGRLITRRLPASSGAEGVELTEKSRDVIKVVLDWRAER